MKKSKLDPYCDFIVARLPSKNVCQIVSELAEAGCKVRPSTLTQWLKKLGTAEGIKIPQWGRGRPAKKTIPSVLGFLPQEDHGDIAPSQFPIFLFTLQSPSADRCLRQTALGTIGFPEGADVLPHEWKEPERFSNLSDLELCLVAFMRSKLPPAPLAASRDEFFAWLTKLMTEACKVRNEIREACKARKP